MALTNVKKLKTLTDLDSFKTLDELCQELEKYLNTERKIGEKRKLDEKKTKAKSRLLKHVFANVWNVVLMRKNFILCKVWNI